MSNSKFQFYFSLRSCRRKCYRNAKKKSNLKEKSQGVEIDADVIELATKYFGLGNYNNVSIVNDDAFEFVLKPKKNTI